jgi:hypothetical protein
VHSSIRLRSRRHDPQPVLVFPETERYWEGEEVDHRPASLTWDANGRIGLEEHSRAGVKNVLIEPGRYKGQRKGGGLSWRAEGWVRFFPFRGETSLGFGPWEEENDGGRINISVWIEPSRVRW